MKRFAFAVLATVAVAFAAVAVAQAYQYRGPNAPFPDGNPAAPLDTSQHSQLKDGSLGFSVGATGAVLKFQQDQSLSVGGRGFLVPATGGTSPTTYLRPAEGGLVITTNMAGATATVHVSNLCFGENQTDCKSTWAGVGSGGSDSFWKLFPGGIEYASSANPGVSMGKGGALANVSVTGNLSVVDGPNTRNTAYYYEQIAYSGTAPNTLYTTSSAVFSWWQAAFPAEFGSAGSWEAIRITGVMTGGECDDTFMYSRQCRETIYSAPDNDPERNRFVYDLWMQQPVGEPGFSVGYTKFEKKKGTRAGGTLNAMNGVFTNSLAVGAVPSLRTGFMVAGKASTTALGGGSAGALAEIFDTSWDGTSGWRTPFAGLAFGSAPGYDFAVGKKSVDNANTFFQVRRQDGKELLTIDKDANVSFATSNMAYVPAGTTGSVNASRYFLNGQPLSSEDPRWSVVPGGIAYNGGSVGIGTGTSTGPTANLQVKGSVRISGTSPRITFGDGNVDSRLYGPGPLSPSNHPDLLNAWASEFGSSAPDTCDNNVGTAGGGTINGNTPPSGIYSCPGGTTRQCRDVYWGPANRGGTWVSGWFADKVVCYANTDEVVSVSNQGGTFTVNNKNEQSRLSVSQNGVVTVNGPSSTLSVMTGNGGFGGIYGAMDAAHGWTRGLIGHGVDVTATGYKLTSQYGGSLLHFGNSNWLGFSALPANAQNMAFTSQQLIDNYTQFKVLEWGTETKNQANINGANGAWLIVNGSTSTASKYAGIALQANGVNKWSLFKSDQSNNNLYVGRYDAGGAYIDSPVQIVQDSGKVILQNGLVLPQGAANDRVLTSDGDGNASWRTLTIPQPERMISEKGTLTVHCTAGRTETIQMNQITEIVGAFAAPVNNYIAIGNLGGSPGAFSARTAGVDSWSGRTLKIAVLNADYTFPPGGDTQNTCNNKPLVVNWTAFGYRTGGPLTLTPASVSLAAGQQVNVAVGGGTLPFSIQTQPNSSFANATVNGSTITVTGVGTGNTSLVLRDAGSPAQTITLPITVTAGWVDTYMNTSYPSYPGMSCRTWLTQASARQWNGTDPIRVYRTNLNPNVISGKCLYEAATAPGWYSFELPDYANNSWKPIHYGSNGSQRTQIYK